MKIYGLTGGIASGKSTISQILKTKDLPIVDADMIARSVLAPGTKGFKQVLATFGEAAVFDAESGTIDRKKLGRLVFNDRAQRKKLEKITHPKIAFQMIKAIVVAFFQAKPVLILDVPLLYESKFWAYFCTKVMVVHCEESTQMKRLLNREEGKMTEDTARKIVEAQMPLDKKVALADIVIDNNGPKRALEEHVEKVYKDYLSPTLSRRVQALAWLTGLILVICWLFFQVVGVISYVVG
mmetsp:Transcript_16860/g.25189  ORF Transcript_16860/g.25189 Transcript_16860/m.25189 type:complete len:239 (+) Transcript_16860:20-736(+)